MSLRVWIDLCEGVDDLQRRYDHFNALLFDDRLPRIPLSWAVMKNQGGIALAKVTKDPSKRPPSPLEVRLGLKDKYADRMLVPGSLAIKLSSTYKRSQEATDGILIHEMIHILMYVTGHFGDAHGLAFVRELRRCSEIVGFPVPMTDVIDGLEVADALKTKLKHLGVILGKKRDDGYTYAIFAADFVIGQQASLSEKITYFVRYNYWTKGYLCTIANAMWTAQALKVPVQRKYAGRYFRLGDPAVAADLIRNGTVLFQSRQPV